MILPQHRDEWKASGIDDAIINLNLRSLPGYAPYERLFYSSKLERTNTGRVASWMLKLYAHVEKGGWWGSGLDPLDDWQSMEWGCFKPDCPRIDKKGKLVKYEHPPKTETRIFFLRVSLKTWKAIAARYNVSMPEVQVSSNSEAIGFWTWVLDNKIPICIAEGIKKAAALLSSGFAAIALPGINSGYRQPKDENGDPVGNRHLIPELAIFKDHLIYFVFDHDTKRKTVRAVNNAIKKTGKLLAKQGCEVFVITWKSPEKGVDDFLVANGVAAFEKYYDAAQLLERWELDLCSQLTYPVNVSLNQKYLGELDIPSDAKLIAIKSPKGSGKTESLARIAADAAKDGKWVLILTHRVQLGQELCRRMGVPYVNEIKESETGKLLGFGLCIDSLHPNSQAKFQAENWRNGLVIIDECEQVLWHLLNSSTCKKNRVPILRQFKTLITNALTSEKGQVILSDADLSDISVDHIRGLAGVNTEPWIVENTWTSEGWKIFNYQQTTPKAMLAKLTQHIEEGGKPYVSCTGQKVKSPFGTHNLEAYFSQKFPDKKILRIDSETIADPEHPAFGCATQLNRVLPLYDIVIASPSIETGVSIDIKNHFTSVWGILQGVSPENSARQALARVREPVERHIWVTSCGLGRIGNGATTPNSLLASQNQAAKANIEVLCRDGEFDGLDATFEAASLTSWAKFACRVNQGMRNYREAVLAGLAAEGHEIIPVDSDNETGKETLEELTETRNQERTKEAEAIAASRELDQKQYEQLQEKRSKTQHERYQERRYSLKLCYGTDVDPDLVLKDNNNWYPQIAMHYYLTVGKEHLPARDKRRVEAIKQPDDDGVWMPDFNKSVLGAAVAALEILGVLRLMDAQREFKNSDADLQQMAEKALYCSWQVKALLGITIKKNDSPIKIAQKLLGKMGLRLKFLRKEGARGEQQRVYQFQTPADGRDAVFAGWLVRDEAAKLVQENVSSSDTVVTHGNKEYLNNASDYQISQSSNQEEAEQLSEKNIADAVSMLQMCDDPETTLAVFERLRSFCKKAKEAIWGRIPIEKRRQLWQLGEVG